MTDEELKARVREFITSDDNYHLVIVNTLLALLIEKKIFTKEEFGAFKEAVITVMVDKSIEKVGDKSLIENNFKLMDLIKKILNPINL